MVSLRVSPFVDDVTFGSVNPMTRAPSRFAAVSNERRVRVLGSKNKVATMRPSRSLRLGRSSNSCAISMRYRIFSRERFAILTKLLFVIMRVFVLKLLCALKITHSCGVFVVLAVQKSHLFRSPPFLAERR